MDIVSPYKIVELRKKIVCVDFYRNLKIHCILVHLNSLMTELLDKHWKKLIDQGDYSNAFILSSAIVGKVGAVALMDKYNRRLCTGCGTILILGRNGGLITRPKRKNNELIVKCKVCNSVTFIADGPSRVVKRKLVEDSKQSVKKSKSKKDTVSVAAASALGVMKAFESNVTQRPLTLLEKLAGNTEDKTVQKPAASSLQNFFQALNSGKKRR